VPPLAEPSGHSTVAVAAETAYPICAASSRVRLAAFAPHLRAQGVCLRYRPTLTSREYAAIMSNEGPVRKAGGLGWAAARLIATRSLGRDDDVPLLVHRLRFLAPLPGLEPARHVDAYDFDDALYVGSIMPRHRRFRWLKREPERWLSYVRRSRLVIAGNDFLAQRAREHARWVEVIPSCVDPEGQPTREHREREVVTIGWIGSSSTVGYLTEALAAVNSMNERGLTTRVVVVGGGTASPDVNASWLEYRCWSPLSEPADLAGFDIGIMPMPDTEWTRGKCGYKLLQYFAAGVPVVASPVGVNTALVGKHGERGRLAATAVSWRSALEELVRDHDARRAMGSAARRFVESEYSYQRWAPEFASLLREL
jgi:glycosyltransferase involved in cell wall biosynthesis